MMVKADGHCDPTVRLPPGWEGVAVRHCFSELPFITIDYQNGNSLCQASADGTFSH